jgi:glutamate/aspartate transport system permease protein
MNYAWNWGIVFQQPYVGWLITGLGLTLVISVTASLLALVIGTLVGIIASLPNWLLRFLGAIYINAFRNIPFLLQLFIWFFVLPEMLPVAWGNWLKRDLLYPELWTSIVALGLFTASRIAVQTRAGIAAVARGQQMAALASGMGLAKVYRFILLPQAFRVVVPALTSEFLSVFKNSALALTIGVAELTSQSRKIEDYTFHGFESFTAATVLYLAVAVVVTFLMHLIERKTRIVG